jgi:hypothetical protein
VTPSGSRSLLASAFRALCLLSSCGGEDMRSGSDVAVADGSLDVAPMAADSDVASTADADAAVSMTHPRGCLDDASCGRKRCVELVPGGDAACVAEPPEVTSCTDAGSQGECCSSADCPKGSCHGALLLTSVNCGGGGGIGANLCDKCFSDADCPDGICLPAGLFVFVRTCAAAACRVDSDCTAMPGGVCRFIPGGCCPGMAALRDPTFKCLYPNRGCASDDDCGKAFCVIENGEPTCRAECAVNR